MSDEGFHYQRHQAPEILGIIPDQVDQHHHLRQQDGVSMGPRQSPETLPPHKYRCYACNYGGQWQNTYETEGY